MGYVAALVVVVLMVLSGGSLLSVMGFVGAFYAVILCCPALFAPIGVYGIIRGKMWKNRGVTYLGVAVLIGAFGVYGLAACATIFANLGVGIYQFMGGSVPGSP